MPSTLNLLSAAILVALLMQCASGAPVQDALTDSPAGDTSGEEEVEDSSDLLSSSGKWDQVIREVKHHESLFDFPLDVKYFEEDSKIPQPENCPASNLSQEACLRRLAHGLHIYTVLLKHVEKEYPSSLVPSEATQIRNSLGNLIDVIKKTMTDSSQVSALSSSQEEQLLKNIDAPDTFRRKVTALRILGKLRDFVADGRRAVRTRKISRRSVDDMGMTPVSYKRIFNLLRR